MRPHELTYALPNPGIGSDKDALGPSALQTDAEGYLSVHLNNHTDRIIAEKTIHWNHNEELAHPASLRKKEHYPELQNNALSKVSALSQGARDQYVTKIIQEPSKSKFFLHPGQWVRLFFVVVLFGEMVVADIV